MDISFHGAVGEVTGSCYVLRCAGGTLLIECGQIQGSGADEARNRREFPLPVDQIDAVVLSHAHIDHSGRLPLLVRRGYRGPVYTHHASHALCEIMLRDAAYLHEKDAAWENRKRQRQGRDLVTPLFTQDDAEAAMEHFEGLRYGEKREILPGLELCLHDAGHILGAAIVELTERGLGRSRKLVFSGDLGYADAPIMEDPARIEAADLVLMESTYGDRRHRSFEQTLAELGEVFAAAKGGGGNILIPAFAVGRTQDLLYLMAEHFDAWRLGDWDIFLDSPMAIRATEVYSRFRHLYDARLFGEAHDHPRLPNLMMSRTSQDSMTLNDRPSGAIIIAGSGMCSGGRILQHLKHHVWRPQTHVVIVGYQAYGTLGRRLVDGSERIRLWGEDIRVNATIHTIGGLSAHADQQGLVNWYGAFRDRPPVCLVHGEPDAQQALAQRLHKDCGVRAKLPHPGETVAI